MSSNQERNNFSDRLMRWLSGIASALFIIGGCIATVSLFTMRLSSGLTWWARVAALVIMLAMLPSAIIPGALLAARHPWGAAFRMWAEERRFAHPRLLGLTWVWTGLVVIGGLGVTIFVLGLRAGPWYWPVVMYLLGLTPLYALSLFDRRRR